jgi:lipopolysaccharide transport system ATP-binding protein
MSSSEVLLEFSSVSKAYQGAEFPLRRMFELLFSLEPQEAVDNVLSDVNIKIQRGSRLAVIGENGSGKSTLLKMAAGVLSQTKGRVVRQGRIAALLELSAGFSPELSGRENAIQFCQLHGMTSSQTEEKVGEIAEFAEIGPFFEEKLKTYSSGMAMRLGFSCAIQVEPDLLIVDEALSVGDAYFSNKCVATIRSLLKRGVALLFVSHSPDSVKTLCDEAIWLRDGRIYRRGSSEEVVDAYQSYMYSRFTEISYDRQSRSDLERRTAEIGVERKQRRQRFSELVKPNRVGTGDAKVIDIWSTSEDDQARDRFDAGEKVVIRIDVDYSVELRDDNLALCVGITDSDGKEILHFNTKSKDIELDSSSAEQSFKIEFEERLCPGEYGVVAGVGLVKKHPISNGLSIVETVLDHCAGGARFKIEYPVLETSKDLWGVIDSDYAITKIQ